MDHAADAMRTDLMTITRYVLNEQSRFPEARGDLTILLNNIVSTRLQVCLLIRQQGWIGQIDWAGRRDKRPGRGAKEARCLIKRRLRQRTREQWTHKCPHVSDEIEDAIFVEKAKRGRYCVVFDRLDGSLNIDCGVSIGTIFGIYMLKDGIEGTVEDVLQPGTAMLAAGYCMYGSSCTVRTYALVWSGYSTVYGISI
ncbi:hypothetical protein M758_10G021600 [Ceratodon purpureus]|nr:hypothetical protein M758_10G021600 [Ceratodon purpureus]